MRSSVGRLIVRVALCVLAGSQAARAKFAPEWTICNGRSHAAPDIRIEECTVLIESGQVSDGIRAGAYINRANAWRAKGDLDRARRPVESSWFSWLKYKGKPRFEIHAFRCPRCGYLESYAPGA